LSPFYRSSDLSTAPSSPSLGLRTSRWLRRCPLQVARPLGGSVVAVFRSSDLPASPLSSTSGCQTSRRLCRRPIQQKAIGSLSLLGHQTGHSGRFTARGLLHECILRNPLASTSHRPTGSLLPLLLYSTYLRLALRPF
jgi:hypothetical protein